MNAYQTLVKMVVFALMQLIVLCAIARRDTRALIAKPVGLHTKLPAIM